MSQHVVFWHVCVFACAWQINTKKDRENVLVYAYTREHVSARAFSLTLMRAYARECQRERERRCVISDSKTQIYTYTHMKTGAREGQSSKGAAGKHQGMCA